MPPFPPPPEPHPYNLNHELARERHRAAAERTLIAWIRTALSLIGFGIDRLVAAVQTSRLSSSDRIDLSVRLLSIGLIAIGNLALVVAVFQHQQVLKRLRRNDFRYNPPIPVAPLRPLAY